MTTSPFSRLPIRVSISRAPYELELEIGFKSFDGQLIDMDESQFLGIQARVHVRTRQAAEEVAKELRRVAEEIEAYAPNMGLPPQLMAKPLDR